MEQQDYTISGIQRREMGSRLSRGGAFAAIRSFLFLFGKCGAERLGNIWDVTIPNEGAGTNDNTRQLMIFADLGQ